MGEFGKRVRDLRIRQQLTLQQLASIVGKTAGYLSRIEGRDEIPNGDFTCSLADALRADPEELLQLAKHDALHRVEQDLSRKHQEALELFRRGK